MPTIDSAAPEFEALATGNQTIKSEPLRGKNVVLYFYPKDDTPGCTREGQDFRDQHDAFAAANCVILGVSRDSVASHERFREKFNFPFHLLSDSEQVLCQAFDVIKEKNMYGRKYLGIERSTFLIDSEGILRREWRKVKVSGHADEVLQAVQDL